MAFCKLSRVCSSKNTPVAVCSFSLWERVGERAGITVSSAPQTQ